METPKENTLIKLSIAKSYSYTCHFGDFLSGFFIPRDRQIVINGFWRSGTTWLQESLASKLNARSVFEPLNCFNSSVYNSERLIPIKRCLPEFSPPRYDYAFANLFMPFVSDSISKFPTTYKVIDRALRGQMVMRMYGDRHKTLNDCLSSTVVTKFTRASLCLNGIAQSFHVPIIHIYRDPRATITSIQTLEGGNFAEGTFNQLSLVDQLLNVEDGRYEYFHRWQSDIEALEKMPITARLAAYICLTERYLEDTFQFKDSLKRLKVCYEQLVLSQEQAFERLALALGFESNLPPANPDKPSVTDWNQAKNSTISTQDRLMSWQKKLSSDDRRLIEEVVATFKMEHRLWA